MPEQGYKRCNECGEEKPVEAFGREPRVRDGRQARCKACMAVKKREWQIAHPESGREAYDRWRARNLDKARASARRYKRENAERCSETGARWRQENPEKREAQRERYAERYPEKLKAHRAVANAVNRGMLIKPGACEDCEGEFEPRLIHGHHDDYSKPLDVRWLCPACHAARHKREGKGL